MVVSMGVLFAGLNTVGNFQRVSFSFVLDVVHTMGNFYRGFPKIINSLPSYHKVEVCRVSGSCQH